MQKYVTEPLSDDDEEEKLSTSHTSDSIGGHSACDFDCKEPVVEDIESKVTIPSKPSLDVDSSLKVANPPKVQAPKRASNNKRAWKPTGYCLPPPSSSNSPVVPPEAPAVVLAAAPSAPPKSVVTVPPLAIAPLGGQSSGHLLSAGPAHQDHVLDPAAASLEEREIPQDVRPQADIAIEKGDDFKGLLKQSLALSLVQADTVILYGPPEMVDTVFHSTGIRFSPPTTFKKLPDPITGVLIKKKVPTSRTRPHFVAQAVRTLFTKVIDTYLADVPVFDIFSGPKFHENTHTQCEKRMIKDNDFDEFSCCHNILECTCLRKYSICTCIDGLYYFTPKIFRALGDAGIRMIIVTYHWFPVLPFTHLYCFW